jgi:hypothetical protein
MSKWILAAVLFAGVVTAAPADVRPVEPKNAPVKVEIRGRLSIIDPIIEQKEGFIHGCLQPRMFFIDADGQRFNLNIGRFGQEAQKFNGQFVVITGTLDLDTVTVTGLTVPLDEALIQYVKVTIEGHLSITPRDFPPYDLKHWHIQSGKATYTLAFSHPKVEADATHLMGMKVVLKGRLKNGVVTVEEVSGVGIWELAPRMPFEQVAR